MAQATSAQVTPIGRDLARILFRSGLDRVENAYRATIEPVEDVKSRADSIARQAFGLSLGEIPPEVSIEEDGSFSPDFSDSVYTVEYEAEETSSLIREAFLITLFHFWEKQSNLWLGVRGTTYNHLCTMAWLKSQNYLPNELEIRKLQFAANCVKHGPGKACHTLYGLDQSFFARPAVSSMGSSRNFVQTTIPMMDSFFEVVRQSGPI